MTNNDLVSCFQRSSACSGSEAADDKPVGRLSSFVCLTLLLIGIASHGICASVEADRQQGSATASRGESGAALNAGKAALEDGLYEIAERQFRRHFREAGRKGEKNREAVVHLVRAIYEQQKYEEILEVLKPRSKLVRGVPDNGAFVFWRALALYEMGKIDKALAMISEFEEDYPDREYAGRAERLRAWCYLKARKVEEALQSFERFDRMYGDLPEAPQNLLEWAKTLASAGGLEPAGGVLARLVKLSATLEAVQEGHYCLGQILIEEEKWEDATHVLTSLGNNKNADDDLRAEAWFSLVSVFEARTNRTEGLNVLKMGIDLARSPELKRKGSFKVGRLLLEMGRLDEGLPLLKAFVSESPDDPLAGAVQLAVAGALLEQERHNEAVDEFQYYLETFTNVTGLAQAYQGRGWGLINIGRYAEAAAAFEKAYSLFKDSSYREQCLFKVGDAYFANVQYRLARETYERVLSEFPESELGARALFQLAESTARAGEPEKAEETFLQLSGTYPHSPLAEEALIRIAEIRTSQGHWMDAIDCFNKVMNVCSNGTSYAQALYGRGMVRYRLFRFGEALTDLERVVTEFPGSEMIEQADYMRGMCYYWMGRDNDALLILENFIKRSPESQWAPEVLFWIGKHHYNHGNYDEAERTFLLFVEKYPGNPVADDALIRAGIMASKRKEYMRSIELFTRMVKEYPNSDSIAEARFAQANALSELAKFSAAILIFDEIINKYPESDSVAAAWGRKGDCQFTLGADDSKRYEESMESYRVVANSSSAGLDLVMQAEYKIGKCLEKLGRLAEAFEQYYLKVVVRYFEDRENGIWHTESAKVWFYRAARDAADIMEAKKDWRRVVAILERVVQAGVPASDEARERVKKIRAEKWWLFY